MKLYNVCLFLCFWVCVSFAQNISYTDSLQKAIAPLSKEQQLKKIVDIPYEKFVNDISNSEKLIKKGQQIAIAINDSIALAQIYFKLSQICAYKDQSELKVDYILKSIRIYEQLGETLKAGVAYGQLGHTIKRDDVEKSFYYFRKSIKLIESENNTTLIDPVYDNYGSLLLINNQKDSALYYHKKSLALKKLLKDNVGLGYGYANMAEAYSQFKKYNISKKYLDSSLAIRKKLNDNYAIAVSYTHIGDLFFNQQKYNEAILNFKLSMEQANNYNYSHLEKYCAEMITNCYLQLNDYKNAFNYNTIYQTLKDSSINIQTNAKVAELQIEFETEKKEKEIAQQKEMLLKNELVIKTKNLYAILLGSGLLIFSIVSLGLYKRQQHKKREFNNQLQLKEAQTYNKLQDQRLRISRDLHDNIGSQLTFIISSIDNLKFLTDANNEKLKNKLSEINQFATGTIGQLRDTIWAMNKNEISFDAFQSRVLSFIEKGKNFAPQINFKYNANVQSNIIFSSIKGMNIFRVFQEAINNSIKYANATEINIQIIENETTIDFEINDNGKGFDINTIDLGNGLENMQRRIDEVGGSLLIHSKPNSGTTIKISCAKNKTNDV
jgi:signal transduction histidine kinase